MKSLMAMIEVEGTRAEQRGCYFLYRAAPSHELGQIHCKVEHPVSLTSNAGHHRGA